MNWIHAWASSSGTSDWAGAASAAGAGGGAFFLSGHGSTRRGLLTVSCVPSTSFDNTGGPPTTTARRSLTRLLTPSCSPRNQRRRVQDGPPPWHLVHQPSTGAHQFDPLIRYDQEMRLVRPTPRTTQR